MTPQQLIDTATRHQVLLEGLKTGMVTDFQGVFDKLDNTVADILNSLRVDKLDEITRGALEGVLSHLETSQITVMDGAINHYLQQLPGVAGYVGNFEANALRSVLTPEGQKNVQTPPAAKAYEEAMKRPVRATGDLLKPLVDKWGRGAIQRTNNAVRNGYEQGTTVPQIIKNLMGTRPMNYNDGVTAINKRQAATVVRTSVQHVAATAREVTYEENSDLVKGVTWVSTLDSHTTTQCRSLDGHHFPLESGPRPPIHPNCRSTTAPDLNEAFDFLDKGATRSSANGYVDADLTYYDWLKTQSPEFQDTVLGPTRGELLRSGGLSSSEFSDLQLDKNFQPRTLAEMKQVDPVAFQRAGLDHAFTPTPESAVEQSPLPAPARPPAPEPKPEPVVDRATLQSAIDRLLGQTHMTFEDVQALQSARDALAVLPKPPIAPLPAPEPVAPVTRPGSGTATGKVWDIADKLRTDLSRMPTRQEVLAVAREAGINESTVGVQFGKWRKVTGEALVGPTPVPTIPASVTRSVETKLATFREVVPFPSEVPAAPPVALPVDKFAFLKKRLDELLDDSAGVEKLSKPAIEAKSWLKYYYKNYKNAVGDVDFEKLVAKAGVKAGAQYQEALATYKAETGTDYLFTAKDPKTFATHTSREVIHDLLEELNGPKIKQVYEIDKKFAKEFQDKAREAGEFLDRVTSDKFKSKAVSFAVTKSRDVGAHYSRFGNIVTISPEHPTRIFVHEFAHHIEYQSQSAQKMKDFLELRRGNEPYAPHADVKNKAAVVFEDEFVSRGGQVYTSRVYNNADGSTRSTEVLSTGAERLFQDPLAFYRRDPEHFEVVVRALLNI